MSWRFPHSSLRQWLASLDRLEALKPAIIVPSHGPTGDGTAFITGYRAYLMEVRDGTAAEKRAGRSIDQAVPGPRPTMVAAASIFSYSVTSLACYRFRSQIWASAPGELEWDGASSSRFWAARSPRFFV
jgi:glyoxylase-like metal-dependent hydrolase (beta-lactamase superfamily II)